MSEGDDFCVELARMLTSFRHFQRMSGFLSAVRLHNSWFQLIVDPEGGYSTTSELNSSQFIRLPREFDPFHGSEGSSLIRLLKDLCRDASRSEDFFLCLSQELWLRTVLKSESSIDEFLSSDLTTEQCSKLRSGFTIQSNVVPCQPYWEKLQVVRNGAAGGTVSKGIYFPYAFLEESELQFVTKLENWKETREEHKIVSRWIEIFDSELSQDIGRTDLISRPLIWKIEPKDVTDFKLNNEKGGSTTSVVREMLWRGGIFARKDFKKKSNPEPTTTFIEELKVVQRIGTHPHIVYSFGVSSDSQLDTLWMEMLDGDLWDLISDLTRDPKLDPPKLPFSLMDSMDIVLQIAKAMKHLHELNVVHGDLKSANILISHCEVIDCVKHYIVKVADFGGAQIIESDDESPSFRLALGTTGYIAPEVLEARNTGIMVAGSTAKKSDVYSFGIVAFEVLSGNLDVDNVADFDAIMAGTDLKQNFSEACGHDPDLEDLINRCLDHNPVARPSFAEVTKELDCIVSFSKLWSY